MSFAAQLDHAAARATPEQRELVRRLRRASEDKPSSEREAARAEIGLRVHGIEPGWACTCGAPYTYPHSACPSCRRDYPRRCTTPGCGVVNEPVAMVTLAGVPCGEVARSTCPRCTTDIGRRARAQSYARSSIPPRERAWGAQVLAYHEHQTNARQTLTEWVDRGPDSRTWKRDKSDIEASLGGTCAVYLSGNRGSGKSVLAARTVHRAFVDQALVDDFRWHSQDSLAALFAARHVGNDDARAAALNAWRAIVDTPLLVVDDLFVSVPTPALATALAGLFRERLDFMRPTIVTSNVPPQWGVYLETDEVGRLESRWRGYGVEVVVSGPDLRC